MRKDNQGFLMVLLLLACLMFASWDSSKNRPSVYQPKPIVPSKPVLTLQYHKAE